MSLKNSVIRVTLEPTAAKAEADALERTLRDVETRRKELARASTITHRQEDAAKSRKRQEGEQKRMAFALPPLTAADVAAGVAGAIPGVQGFSGAIGLFVGLERKFGGGAVGMLHELAEQLPAGIGTALKSVSEPLMKARGKLNDAEAFLGAFQPTFEQVKQVAKAQLLASGAVDTADVGSFLQNEFKIQEAQLRLRKSIQDETMRQLGSSGTKQLIAGLRKASRKN